MPILTNMSTIAAMMKKMVPLMQTAQTRETLPQAAQPDEQHEQQAQQLWSLSVPRCSWANGLGGGYRKGLVE
uniref:Uncharacterized protein n=1 Tax=Anopheles arabiensis TaxID=7173 RepID=A0A182HHB1_ANOAR